MTAGDVAHKDARPVWRMSQVRADRRRNSREGGVRSGIAAAAVELGKEAVPRVRLTRWLSPNTTTYAPTLRLVATKRRRHALPPDYA